MTLTDADRLVIVSALHKAMQSYCDNVEHCAGCMAYLTRGEDHFEGCELEASLRILQA